MWADHLFSFRIHAMVGFFFVYRKNVSFLLLIKTWQWRLLCQLRGVLTEFLGIFTTNKKKCVQAEGAQLLQSVWKFSFYRLSLVSSHFYFLGQKTWNSSATENVDSLSCYQNKCSLACRKLHNFTLIATIWNLKFSTSQALVTARRWLRLEKKNDQKSNLRLNFRISFV